MIINLAFLFLFCNFSLLNMLQKYSYSLIQVFILYYQYEFISGKSLLGENVVPIRENEYANVVCILRRNVDFDYTENMLCTGTLISAQHVITAHHCFKNVEETGMEIAVGSHNILHSYSYYPMWWMSYTGWAERSGRPATPHCDDIAIVKILGYPIQTAPAILSALTDHTLLHGRETQVVGCGALQHDFVPPEKHSATVKILTRDECESRASNIYGSKVRVSNTFLCTSSDPYTFVNDGDSGGPLFFYGTLVGLTVAICPETGDIFHPHKVNLHISVAMYREFIIDMLQK